MSERLFTGLLEVSLAVSLAVIVLKLLGARLGRAYGAKWKYWVWLLLAVRLLIPVNFSLSSPPVSMRLPDLPLPALVDELTVQPTTDAPGAQISPARAEIAGPTIRAYSITTAQALMLLWAVGGAAFLAYQLLGYITFTRRLRRWSQKCQRVRITAMLDQLAQETGCQRPVPLFISPGLPSPLITGFIRPSLFLPADNYQDEELGYILRHELIHYRRGDLWYKLLLILANAVHWFNPFVYLLFREASADLELSCDAELVQGLSFDQRRAYSDAILACACSKREPAAIFSTCFHGGAEALKTRLINIFRPEQTKNGWPAALATILIVLVLGSLVACQTATKEDELLTGLGYTKTLVAEILAAKTSFSDQPGHTEKIAAIVQTLPLPSYRTYKSYALRPGALNELDLIYEFDDHYDRGGNGLDPFPMAVEENNALLLFAAMEGLDQVNFLHYDSQELNMKTSCSLNDLSWRFGPLRPADLGREELYQALGSSLYPSEFYFAHYSRIYLGTDQEAVSYRNGEPHQVNQQADGSAVWTYEQFGTIYSLSPEGPDDDSKIRAFYYFDSPAAREDDNLSGLYATRFVHGDHFHKTRGDIIRLLGRPTVSQSLAGGGQYLAYALAEGQGRHAYFIFHEDRVLEEGVMYAHDYEALTAAAHPEP